MPRLSIAITFAMALWLWTTGPAFSQTDSEPGKAAFLAGNYAEAMAIWLPLAEAGDSHAQFNVGLLHDEGLGTESSPDQARKWWRMAAAQDLLEAEHNLALLELELASQNPPAGDLDAAREGLIRAADGGHQRARYTLGKLYELGLGVEADPEASAGHILIAAQAGLPRAQYNMGKRYRDGSGVDQDDALAAEWFRRAALAGHPGGQDHYARRLKDGTGIDPDPVKAMTMAILAARAGYEQATELANELKVPLSIEELDRAFSEANAFEAETVVGPVE